jgi:hypothetical protein
VLLAGALVFGPVRQNFRIAQAYTLLLLLFVAAWRQSERGRASSGVLLGLATAFKWQGLPVWAILAASRKWRAVAAGAATVLAVVGVSSLATGWTSWPTYFNHMMTAPPRNWMLSIEFQGTHNLITHLLVADPAFNPRPLTHNPRAAIVISSALSVAAVAFTMWRARRMPVPHAFAAAVALSVVLSPFALDYHYTLLFLPLAVMSNAVRHSRTIPDTLWLSIVVAMTAVPWRRYLPQLDEMAFGLYAFVRLYGGWLLWLWLIRRKDDVRSAAPGGS